MFISKSEQTDNRWLRKNQENLFLSLDVPDGVVSCKSKDVLRVLGTFSKHRSQIVLVFSSWVFGNWGLKLFITSESRLSTTGGIIFCRSCRSPLKDLLPTYQTNPYLFILSNGLLLWLIPSRSSKYQPCKVRFSVSWFQPLNRRGQLQGEPTYVHLSSRRKCGTYVIM